MWHAEPVFKDRPICLQKCGLSRVKTGGLWWQVDLHWNVGLSAKNWWSFKTGTSSFSWQCSLKAGLIVACVVMSHTGSGVTYTFTYLVGWHIVVSLIQTLWCHIQDIVVMPNKDQNLAVHRSWTYLLYSPCSLLNHVNKNCTALYSAFRKL